MVYLPFVLLLWLLVARIEAYDPVRDFCRRWFHQSAVGTLSLWIH
jgi:hypothetical protein